MADENKPDAVVPDAIGRQAIARLEEGIAETQVRAGVPIPGGRDVEDWARSVVEKQIRIHEDRMRNGVPDAGHAADPAVASPSRIDRGDVGENTQVIYNDDIGKGWTAPRGKRRVNMQVDPRPLEDILLEARLKLLQFFPCERGCTGPATDLGHQHPWFDRLMATDDEALAIAKRNGFADQFDKVVALRNELMMRIVEQSGQPVEMGGLGLGDYRTPKSSGPRRLFLIGAGGQLTPMPDMDGNG